MNVKNKVFVVTGAGSGMGREITLTLLARGALVAAVDINEENLQKTEDLVSSNAQNLKSFVLNIVDIDAVNQIPAQIIAEFGHIDGLINNAGIIQPFERIKDISLSTIERVINVNLYGSLYLIKALLPYLQKRQEAHLINVSSMGALVPVPGQVMYGASKAAIKLLTDGLRSELADTSIHVSLVIPGAVNTNITSNSGVAGLSGVDASGDKVLSAEKAARIIVDGIEKNKARIFVGKDARILDILSRISPAFASSIINKSMAKLLPPSA